MKKNKEQIRFFPLVNKIKEEKEIKFNKYNVTNGKHTARVFYTFSTPDVHSIGAMYGKAVITIYNKDLCDKSLEKLFKNTINNTTDNDDYCESTSVYFFEGSKEYNKIIEKIEEGKIQLRTTKYYYREYYGK